MGIVRKESGLMFVDKAINDEIEEKIKELRSYLSDREILHFIGEANIFSHARIEGGSTDFKFTIKAEINKDIALLDAYTEAEMFIVRNYFSFDKATNKTSLIMLLLSLDHDLTKDFESKHLKLKIRKDSEITMETIFKEEPINITIMFNTKSVNELAQIRETDSQLYIKLKNDSDFIKLLTVTKTDKDKVLVTGNNMKLMVSGYIKSLATSEDDNYSIIEIIKKKGDK